MIRPGRRQHSHRRPRSAGQRCVHGRAAGRDGQGSGQGVADGGGRRQVFRLAHFDTGDVVHFVVIIPLIQATLRMVRESSSYQSLKSCGLLNCCLLKEMVPYNFALKPHCGPKWRKTNLIFPTPVTKLPKKQILLQIIRFNILRSLKLGNTEGLLSNQTSLGTRLLPGRGPPDAPVMVPRHRHRGAVLPLIEAPPRAARPMPVPSSRRATQWTQPSGSRAGCDAESTVRACFPF